ncbi:MAG: tyrosine-type recombinase/integrase [Nanohaloarchaea archaeon]|nr:tyrosine-type recombinase/integrase [Candidatus Nanohaloarchaea archaeon]
MSQNNVRTLSRQELRKLWMNPEDERIHMLFKTTAKLGLRNSEAVTLQKKNLDLENQTVEVKNSKNDKSRTVPIPDNLLEELRIYTQQLSPQEYLFPSKRSDSHLTPRAFQKKVRKHSLEAGLYPTGITEEDVKEMPYEERIMPHSLRHSYATIRLNEGQEMSKVKRLLGHESIQTTVDQYYHLKIDDLKDAVNEIEI